MKTRISLFISLCLLCLISVDALGQGDLMIYPKRLVFTPGQRTMDITLVNTGSDSANYNISWVNYRMTETGKFEEIDEPDPGMLFASSQLRFFPRSISLAPNEAQKIKVQLIRPQRLEKGEYRSHMMFKAAKPAAALGEETAKTSSDGISTKLIMHFAITIPIIIESGDLQGKTSISATLPYEKEDGTHVIDLTLTREGNKSMYGDIKAVHLSDEGISREVAIIKGIAVYTPLNSRRYTLKLKDFSQKDWNSGEITIEYTAQEGKREVLAREVIKLR